MIWILYYAHASAIVLCTSYIFPWLLYGVLKQWRLNWICCHPIPDSGRSMAICHSTPTVADLLVSSRPIGCHSTKLLDCGSREPLLHSAHCLCVVHIEGIWVFSWAEKILKAFVVSDYDIKVIAIIRYSHLDNVMIFKSWICFADSWCFCCAWFSN